MSIAAVKHTCPFCQCTEALPAAARPDALAELADKLQGQRVHNNGKHPEGRILLGMHDVDWDTIIAALRGDRG